VLIAYQAQIGMGILAHRANQRATSASNVFAGG
jgi:hypothetical protein